MLMAIYDEPVIPRNVLHRLKAERRYDYQAGAKPQGRGCPAARSCVKPFQNRQKRYDRDGVVAVVSAPTGPLPAAVGIRALPQGKTRNPKSK